MTLSETEKMFMMALRLLMKAGVKVQIATIYDQGEQNLALVLEGVVWDGNEIKVKVKDE